MVEVFARREISGWVEVRPGTGPVRVSLYVNEEEVLHCWAVDPAFRRSSGETRRFRFVILDIWRFVSSAHKLTVRAGRRQLPITAKGMFYHPKTDGKESLTDLRALQSRGWVFSQSGTLQLSKAHDNDWQLGVLNLSRQVSEIVELKHGYRPFLCYGTLLGAVRDGGFIGHDLDFDCAYLSRYTDGRKAAQEIEEISATLIAAGFQVIPKFSCVAIADRQTGAKIDLFHLYPRPDGQIAFPFGIAGNSSLTLDDLIPLVRGEFLGQQADFPARSEAVVEHLYGASWRTPNASFSWKRDRLSRDREGLLGVAAQQRIYWTDFYSHQDQQPAASACASYLLDRPEIRPCVVDLGCGDGRDAIAIAEQGLQVIGIDQSALGLERAISQTGSMAANLKFISCDLTDPSALTKIIKQVRADHNGAPITFYARFLLSSLSDAGQRSVLKTLHRTGVEGDQLLAEFRTEQDRKLPKTYFANVRRFVDSAPLLDELKGTYGYQFLDQQEGTGLAKHRDEDPYVFRLLAQRG